MFLVSICFRPYIIVSFLFRRGFTSSNLVLIVIGINLMSDIAGFYSGRLEMPLIVDTEELAEAEGFEK